MTFVPGESWKLSPPRARGSSWQYHASKILYHCIQFLAKEAAYPMVTLQRRGRISGPGRQGMGVRRGPKETMWQVIPVPTGMVSLLTAPSRAGIWVGGLPSSSVEILLASSLGAASSKIVTGSCEKTLSRS